MCGYICACLALGLALLLATMAQTENYPINRGEEWPRRGGRRHGSHEKVRNLGVNYGMVANNLPAPEEVSRMLQGTAISSVKLYTPDARVLQAFAHTDISVVAGVPDEDIPILGGSSAAAMSWVAANILPFYPATNIIALVVGNEVLSKTSSDVADHLVPAMENLYNALLYSNIQNVSVSTTHSMAVLASSYPPSAAQFQPQLLPLINRLLSFLSATSSPFMSNSYPFFAYQQNSDVISLDYALFRPNAGVSDSNTGLHYTNLFDAQVDAIYYAMKSVGFDNIPVVVAESGWPSAGDSDEVGASLANAQEYNSNLIKHIASNVGTPSKPNTMIYTYIFALFNEDLKPGPTSERNFGLFHPDETKVYDVGIQLGAPVTLSTTNTTIHSAHSPETTTGGASTWCVAKPATSDALLQQSLQFACGEGGADCKHIQPGGGCFNPNSLVSHASYAMNSYYQLHGRNSWNCYFNGEGMLTPTDPSYGSCVYPSQ